MNQELPDVQPGFQKGRGTRDQIVNIRGIIEKAREFQKNICFIDYAKAFDCGKFFKKWEYQTTLLASRETCLQVKKQQSKSDMEQRTGSKLGKEYIKAVYCHPAYLTYMQSTYIMKNARLNEAQAGIKISRRNIRYANDTTLNGRK